MSVSWQQVFWGIVAALGMAGALAIAGQIRDMGNPFGSESRADSGFTEIHIEDQEPHNMVTQAFKEVLESTRIEPPTDGEYRLACIALQRNDWDEHALATETNPVPPRVQGIAWGLKQTIEWMKEFREEMGYPIYTIAHFCADIWRLS